jgi:hypothetical protein
LTERDEGAAASIDYREIDTSNLNSTVTFNMLGILRTSILRPRPLIIPRTPTLPWCRTYALSRFAERATGAGRKTRTTTGKRISPNPGGIDSTQVPYEEKPSIDESELWNVSRRLPSGDPEMGLRALLGNESLVITRLAASIGIYLRIINRRVDNSKC